jgi:hypothetical protein
MNSDKIIIVGGGSAGWMTAATLIKAYPEKDITVIESPDIPTISVGESTIARVKFWTKFLEIDDEDFLKQTNGIIKLSIKFTDFYKKGESFHYPFGAVNNIANIADTNDWWFKKELFPETPNSDYAESMWPVMAMVNQNKLTKEDFHGWNYDNDTAYHFDAIKFGVWLRDNYCLPRGVKHIQEDIKNIETDENGIKSLNGKHTADLYVDCTGFKSLLLGETLKEPFESLEDKLPNNKAWACKMPYTNKEEELVQYTNCTAIDNGWVWNIPLWDRIGTGYVYSDKFVDDETALEEFKKHLGRDDLEFKNIKMKTGIYRRLFVKNVAAVGLSAAFIEPLESNGLFTVHEFAIELVRNLRRGTVSQWDKDNYTSKCKFVYSIFSEFVGAHYALSHRDDTEYWRANNNKEWSSDMIDLTPKSWGYPMYAKNRNNNFTNMDGVSYDGGGFHCIAAGMNWAPTDMTTLRFYNKATYQEISDDKMPCINRLNQKKNKWIEDAKHLPSVLDYLKENIHK